MASPPSNATSPPSESSAPPPKDSLSPPPPDASPPPPDASPPPPDASLPPPTKSPPSSPPNASPLPPASSSPPPSPPIPSPPTPSLPLPADNNSPPSIVPLSPPLPQLTNPALPSNPGVLPPPSSPGVLPPPSTPGVLPPPSTPGVLPPPSTPGVLPPPSTPGVLPSSAPKEGTIHSPPGQESSHKAPESSDGGSSSQSTSAIQNDDISINRPVVVIGVIVGCGLFFILILACALICFCRRKKNKTPGRYDAEGGEDYYKNKGSTPAKWRPRGKNHKIPPPPGMIPPPGNAGWQHHGPFTPSEEMGSSVYSPDGANSLSSPSPSPSLGFNKSTFTYEELAAATGGFSQSNILGQGGFGYVYKGILPNGKEVAIKQLKAGSGQGEREFHAEVEIISRVHHRHLVSLVGYCIAGAQRLLVYEFVPNNTLEYHLHGKGVPTMDWPTRLKIAIGSAKGLAYLHEDCHLKIIHRDIKTANILLDNKFEAMVADFGLAKLSPDTHTHVSTRIMGTFGYLAPEYASSGKLTNKSDVFSYGVMLLELITGRKPVDHTNMMDEGLVEWARPRLARILAEENYDDLVDPKLEGNYNKIELNRMIICAAASVRHSGKARPRMSQIVRALEGDMVSLDDISAAARVGQSSLFSSSGSEVETRSHSSKMRQFNKLALASQVYTGEYSGHSVTSQYGLNPSDSSSGSSEEFHPDAKVNLH